MLSVSKILVPVVFSERCRAATKYAAALSHHFQAELTLLHVIVPPHPPYGGVGGTAPALAAGMLSERRVDDKQRLKLFLEEELGALGVRRVSLEGDPAPLIVRYAREVGADLIVMPTHGYGLFRRFLLGSVTAKVLHDAECPVCTGPHLESPPPQDASSFDTVLCAVGAEPHHQSILAWAAGFAVGFGARLIVYHAALSSPLTAKLADHYFDPVFRARVVDEARARIQAMLHEAHAEADLRIEMRGDVPDALAEAAVNCHAGLVVIGRGQNQGAGRMRSGVYTIIRESPCPVVSI
jgi:nucleotide-binding universal stress UspA family protein